MLSENSKRLECLSLIQFTIKLLKIGQTACLIDVQAFSMLLACSLVKPDIFLNSPKRINDYVAQGCLDLKVFNESSHSGFALMKNIASSLETTSGTCLWNSAIIDF